jgi:hypothetical protein
VIVDGDHMKSELQSTRRCDGVLHQHRIGALGAKNIILQHRSVSTFFVTGNNLESLMKVQAIEQ